MPRPKIETAIRREQIAEATLALVAEGGFKRLGVAAVARRVGISPAALYRHYPGKDAILDAVLERMRDRMRGIVARAAAGPGDAVAALRRLHALHMALVRQDRDFFPTLISSSFQDGGPERGMRVYDFVSAYLDEVGAVVRRGQKEGSIRGDVAPRTVALMFFGAVQPSAMLWVFSRGAHDTRRHAREAWTLFEQTLRPAATARPRASATARRTRRTA